MQHGLDATIRSKYTDEFLVYTAIHLNAGIIQVCPHLLLRYLFCIWFPCSSVLLLQPINHSTTAPVVSANDDDDDDDDDDDLLV